MENKIYLLKYYFLLCLNIVPLFLHSQCSVSFSSCPTGVVTILDCDKSGDEPINWPIIIANPSGNCAGFNLLKVGGPVQGSPVPIGTYQVAYQAQGLDGNQQVISTSNCVFSVSIIPDNQAPIFSYCPPNITVYGKDDGMGNCNTQVFWPTPISSDNCGQTTLSTTPSSKPCGDSFNNGTSTVTYISTDASGNSATCSFTVTVICQVKTTEKNAVLDYVRILPNPNSGVFNVEIPIPADASMLFRLIDPSSRLMMEKIAEEGKSVQALDASTLPSGLYFLQIIQDGQILATEKFVKQ
jgi:hypothetical protein